MFWFSVETVWPVDSCCSRTRFNRAVWSSIHLAWSKSLGSLAQFSWWALNHAAHSQEFSPVSRRGREVAQI